MYILFDIGGTKMRLAASADGRTFSEPKIIPTPKDFDEGIKAFCECAHALASGQKIDAAGGGIAGPLDKERTILVNSPNISGWVNKPLKNALSSGLGCPVFIENDTSIVGLGEATSGAGKGHDIVVYITVSTGVGGTRIVDGKIDRSAFGFEVGHQIIDSAATTNPAVKDGDMCETCSLPGHLEGYISGSAFERRFGKKPYDVTEKSIWDEEARLLAIGLNNTIVHWSPDVVVLGGSMITKNPGISVSEVERQVKEIMKIFPELPEIKKAELEDVGGLHGALAYINQNVQP
jgi:predicted NBD/HSP70 family sugar kinase